MKGVDTAMYGKYLIVTSMLDSYFYPYVKNEHVDIADPYKKMNKLGYFIFRIKRKIGMNFSNYLYNFSLKENYNGIIVFDCACDSYNLQFLKKNHSNVNLYIWNIMKDFMGRLRKGNPNIDIDYIKSCFNHVYSFDKEDCEKYGLEYYPQPYSKDVIVKQANSVYDIVFLGTEKGRLQLLKTIFENIQKFNYKQYYHIYSPTAKKNNTNDFNITNLKISYNSYLKLIAKSKAILDVPQEGQIGFTIRVLESLFLHKKLITTNTDIKNFKIYNRHNIFIIGEDNYDELDSFLNSPYDVSTDKYLKYHDLPTWSAFICKDLKTNYVKDI